jgi:hypothetical protein
MRCRFFALGVLAAALSAAGCGGGSSTATTSTVSTEAATATAATTVSTEAATATAPIPVFLYPVVAARLGGSAERSSGSPTGSGTARITLSRATGKACWHLTFEGIDRPLSAHIHRGSADEAGPVVIPLGDVYGSTGCVLVPKEALAEVSADPGSYYVNIHTRKYLNGAIRGQLHGA